MVCVFIFSHLSFFQTRKMNRICGRHFSAIDNAAAPASICSQYIVDRGRKSVRIRAGWTFIVLSLLSSPSPANRVPFMIGVKTTPNEARNTAGADPKQNVLAGIPAGNIGFSLDYRQQDCV